VGRPLWREVGSCLLYVLQALASAVFLGSESLGTGGHILLSQIWDFPFRLLLRLAGSRWRYSTPPPHVYDSLEWFWALVLCYDRRSAGQSVLKQSTHLGLTTRSCNCLTVAGLLVWGALSDERTFLPFAIATVLASAVIFGSVSRRTRGHILLSRFKFKVTVLSMWGALSHERSGLSFVSHSR
jgi:hypothetical protein